MGEQQQFVRETLDRLAQTQEENEHLSRRRDELEQRLQTLEVEYEELLGETGYVLIRRDIDH